MSARDIFDLISKAIDDNDAELVQQLNDLLTQHGEEVQAEGAMASRLQLPDTLEVQEALKEFGIETAGLEEEGLGLNIANYIAHAQRRIEFISDKMRRPDFLTIVAEGDSWFLHQLLKDTLDQLRSSFNVKSMAAAGDTVENMLASDDYIDEIHEESSRIFLFSGGGNDLLGNGRVGKVALPENPDLDPADLIDESFFQPLLDQVVEQYRGMIEILFRRAPGVQIFSHGYDYVTKIDKGPWIWPFLKAKGYSKPRGRALVRVLLDRLNTELHELDQMHSNFTYVNTRNLVGNTVNAWYDSIHPKNAGFERVASKFADEINAFFIGASRTESSRPAQRKMDSVKNSGFAEPTIEAVIRDFSNPNTTDFEAARRMAKAIPDDKSKWRKFSDPLVYEHIDAVLKLLRIANDKEKPSRVQNRQEMRPATTGEADIAVYDAVEDPPHAFDEALFGESEIEPIQMLMEGYQSSRAVGRIQVMSPHGSHISHGTGFMVVPGLLLTNHHVLRNADEARRSYVIFDDETPMDGSLPRPNRFHITGDIYAGSGSTDYAFVSVEPVNRDGKNLSDYGYLSLIEPSGKAVKFEPVSIIQHPGGDPKAIAMRNSFIMGRVGDGVYYTTDTKGGSSGSPVLNREWQVVALHHRYVPHPIDLEGVLANRGVRVSRIYKNLRHSHSKGESMATKVLHMLSTDRNEYLFAEQQDTLGILEEERTRETELDRPLKIVSEGAYTGLSEAEFFSAIAHEDAMLVEDIPLPSSLRFSETEGGFDEMLPADRDDVLMRIGPEGYRFIVAHEVSSRSYYQRKLRHPIKPGGASGVTIGIGYDLGHQSLEGFREHWADLLEPDAMRRLEACIGKTRGSATSALRTVRDIVIPYDKAIDVFEHDSLPRYFGYLNRHIRDDVLAGLPPDCVATLVSLTFNRGASYQKAGARYQEMRAIRSALNGGQPELVPDLLRAMKRLWRGRPNLRGLLRRRDEEADMFESGLVDMREAFSGSDFTKSEG